ncbi:PREDICTED: E3 ubiquitin-protein ligase RNF130-like, partial [Rhagoletis zephyria]|uniref:E3 ubiquitin-protein ligase RNF130-like n=1 Tax=Rhagoletis zephyria TaxID=28612 RepID=UPI0008116D04
MQFQDDCAICLTNMKYSSVSRILNCKHLFHSKCIAPIVSRNETCPICRNNIVGTQICERKIYKKIP